MADCCRIRLSDGDIIEVELVIPPNYKYNDDRRNDFIHGFDTGTLSDAEIERALRKGWVRSLGKVGEWE